MIQSFRHKGLKILYEEGNKSKVPADMAEKIEEIISALDSAKDISELNRPSLRLRGSPNHRRAAPGSGAAGPGS